MKKLLNFSRILILSAVMAMSTIVADAANVVTMTYKEMASLDASHSDITFGGGSLTSSGLFSSAGYSISAGQTLHIYNPKGLSMEKIVFHFASVFSFGFWVGVHGWGSYDGWGALSSTGTWTGTWNNTPTDLQWTPSMAAKITSVDLYFGDFVKVEFNANGGTGTAPDPYYKKIGSTISMPANTFTRKGYTFVGWAAQTNTYSWGGTVYQPGDSYTVGWYPQILYAQWSNQTVGERIIYLNTGGTGIWGNDNPTFKVRTWKDGVGTVTTTTMTPVDGYCNTYKATIPDNHNRAQFLRMSTDGTVQWNYTNDNLEIPSTTDWRNTYCIWWNNGTSSTPTTSADWNQLSGPRLYVWFDKNTGEGTMDADRLDCGGSVTLKSNTFTKTGYEFVGWNTKADGTGVSYADGATVSGLSDNITLYAQWNTVDCWFIGGNWNPDEAWDLLGTEDYTHYLESYTSGNERDFYLVHRQGTTDTRWALEGDATMQPDNCSNWVFRSSTTGGPVAHKCKINTEGHAGVYRFIINTSGTYPVVSVVYPDARFSISYDGNAGSGSMASQTDLQYDDQVTLRGNTFTRTGYVFAGWNTAADGSGSSYSDGQRVTVKGDMTLYAIWSTGLIGITNALSATKGSGGPEEMHKIDHVSVTKLLGESSWFEEYSKGASANTKAVNYTGGAQFYSSSVYDTDSKQSKTSYASDIFVGYSVRVDNGWTLDLSRLIAGFATTANFTWKVQIESSTGSVLYESSSLTISDYSSSSRANDRFVSSLSSVVPLQDLAGTFYVKAYFYVDGTGKYFNFPELLLDGAVTQDAVCPNYDFRYKDASNNWHSRNCFAADPTDPNVYFTDEMALPVAVSYNVGWKGDNAKNGEDNLTIETDFGNMPCGPENKWTLGGHPVNGNLGGALGRFRVFHDSKDANKYVSFYPTVYTLQFGLGDSWSNDKTMLLNAKSDGLHEVEWISAITDVTADELTKQVWVGFKLASAPGYVWMTKSKKVALSTLQTKTGSGDNWVAGGLTNSSSKRGRFRIYSNSAADNLYLTFVPYYHAEYNKNAAEATGEMNWSVEVACESDAASRTIHASENQFERTGYVFAGWNTKADGSGTTYAAGAAIELTGNITLYAIWEPVETLITLDANGHGEVVSGSVDGYSIHRYGEHRDYGYKNVKAAKGYVLTGYYTKREGGTLVISPTGLVKNVTDEAGIVWTGNKDIGDGAGGTSNVPSWMRTVSTATLYAHYSTVEQCVWLSKAGGRKPKNDTIYDNKLNTLCGGANIYAQGLDFKEDTAVLGGGDLINISDPNGIKSVELRASGKSAGAKIFAKYSTDGILYSSVELVTLTAAYADYTLSVPQNTYYLQLVRAHTTDVYLCGICITEGQSSISAPEITWVHGPKVGIVDDNTLQIEAQTTTPTGATSATISGYNSMKGTVATVEKHADSNYYLHRKGEGSTTIYAMSTVNYGATIGTHVFIGESDPFSVYGKDGACRELGMMWKNANLYDGTSVGAYTYVYRPADYYAQYFTLSFLQGDGVASSDANRAQETEGSALNTGKYVGNAFLFSINKQGDGTYGDRRISKVAFFGKQEAGDFEYTIDGENWYAYNSGTEGTVNDTISFTDTHGVTISKTPSKGKSVAGQDAWHEILLPANTHFFGLRNGGTKSGTTHKGAWIRNMGLTVCGFTEVECEAPMIQPTSPLYELLTQSAPYVTTSVTNAGSGVGYTWYNTNYQGNVILTMPDAYKVSPGNVYNLPMARVERLGTAYYTCQAKADCGAVKHSAVFTRVVQPANPTVRYNLEPSAPNGATMTTISTYSDPDKHIASVNMDHSLFYKMTASPTNNGTVGGMTAKIPIKNTSMNSTWDFIDFGFTIQPGYQMTVNQICLEIQSVSYSTYLFSAEMRDEVGNTITGTLTHPEPGVGSMLVFRYDNTIKLEGKVSLKLSAWDPAGHSDAAYRLSTVISIYGDVDPLPAPLLTWIVAPHNGSENDASYVISAAPGNTTNSVTYSSSNEDVATVEPDGTLHYHSFGQVDIRATVEGDNITSAGSTTINRTILVDAAVPTGDCTLPNAIDVTSPSSPAHLDKSGTPYEVKFCKNSPEYAAWTGLLITENTALTANEKRMIQWLLDGEEVAKADGHDVTSLLYRPTKPGLYTAMVTIYDIVDQRKTKASAEVRVQVRLVEAPQQPTITGLTTVEQGDDLVLTAHAEGASSYQWYMSTPGSTPTEIAGATSQTYTWSPTPANPAGRYSFYCVASASNRISAEEDCSNSNRSDAFAVALHVSSGCDWHWGMSELDAADNYVEACTHLSIKAADADYTFSQPLGYEAVAIIGDQYATINYVTPQLTQPVISFPALPETDGTAYLFAYPLSGDVVIVGSKKDMSTGVVTSLGKIGTISGGWTLVNCAVNGGTNGYVYSFTTQGENDKIQVGLCASKACHSSVDGLDVPVLKALNDGDCDQVNLRVTYKTDGSTLSWFSDASPATPLKDPSNSSIDFHGTEYPATQSGSYWVSTTKDGKTTTSKLLTVEVHQSPVFNGPELPDFDGEIGRTYTISTEISGAVSYQWYKCDDRAGTNSVAIPGANGRTFTLSITAAYSGELFFFCVGKNDCAAVPTNVFRVMVTQPTLESCTDASGAFDEQYVDLNDVLAKWNSTKVCYEVTNDRSLQLTAQDNYVITHVSYKVYSSTGEALTYAVGKSTQATFAADDYAWKEKAATGKDAPGLEVDLAYPATDGIQSVWMLCSADGKGNANGKRYISDLCVTVERDCHDAGIRFVNRADSSRCEAHNRKWNDAATPYPLLLTTLTVKYLSSNTQVATVDPATGVVTPLAVGSTFITAYAPEQTIGGDTYCEASVRYKLTITKPDDAADHNPYITLDKQPDGTKTLNLWNSSTYQKTAYDPAPTSIQWYKDGNPVAGATSSTLVPKVSGSYTALVTCNGYPLWSNAISVTGLAGIPVVEKLSPFHYYRRGCNYTAGTDNPTRHLFLVLPQGNTGKPWVASAHKYGSEDRDVLQESVNQWVKADLQNPNMVLLDLKALANRMLQSAFLQVGDSMVITVTPRDAENNYLPEYANSITVYVVESSKRSLAYVVSGGEKSKVVLSGPFLTGYNKYDLIKQTSMTAWMDPVEANEVPLYAQLKTEFLVTPVNGYAYNDLSGTAIYQYEPFDLILLTDYPKTDAMVNGVNDASAPYVNALAALVDYRPILSLKAHMAKANLTAWKTKGFNALPYTPLATEDEMFVLCYSHEMFRQMPDATRPNASNSMMHIADAGFDNGKALQGFRMRDMQGFLNIATICSDYEPSRLSGDTIEEPLVACCERQNNINARMVVLSVNAQATSMITNVGRDAIEAILHYLLYDNPSKVSDCGFEFDNGEGNSVAKGTISGSGKVGDGKWSTPGNWAPYYSMLPVKGSNVRVKANCLVDITTPEVGLVTIQQGKNVQVASSAALLVRGNVQVGTRTEHSYLTTPSMLYLHSDVSGNAVLIHGDEAGNTHATIEMFSTGKYTGAYNTSTWQWVATPFSDVYDAQYNYYGARMFEWQNETKEWKLLYNGDPVSVFKGYCVSHTETNHLYWMQGTLTSTGNATLTATYKGNRAYLFGNSWTAPINISKFKASDFENLVQTIVLFNTGTNQTGAQTAADQNETAGQYVSIPINQASSLGDRYKVIPSMQAFQVRAIRSTASGNTGSGKVSLNLDYERLVRTSAPVHQPMRAPHRVSAADQLENGNTAKLVISVRGEQFADRLYLFANPLCTDTFDNGWDGVKVLGESYAPQLYVVNKAGNWSVSSQPELQGTTMAFKKGNGSEYTIRFEYVGDQNLYLYDVETDTYTTIDNTSEYRFLTNDAAAVTRFIITSYNPNAPTESGTTTDVDDVSPGDGGPKKLLIEDKLFILNEGRLYDATGKLVY